MRRWLTAALTIMTLNGGAGGATAANATDQVTCAATLPGIGQASEHMAAWQAEWGVPGAVGDADLSGTYSGAELVALQDVAKSHEAFVAALADYAARIEIAKAAIAACADG